MSYEDYDRFASYGKRMRNANDRLCFRKKRIFETLSEASKKSLTFHFCCIYRPPQSEISDFSNPYERTVKKDGTFSFKGREFKLSHCGGERVTVCLIPNNKLMAVKDGHKVGEFYL